MAKIYKLVLVLSFTIVWLNSFSQFTNNFIIPFTANGTSGAGRGPVTTFLAHRSNAIYKASEFVGFLSSGDSISRIGWSILTAGSSVSGTMKIYLVNTTDTTNLRSTTWATLLTTPSAMTLVYNGTMTIPAVAGAYSVPLSTSFAYTGGGIYVAYEWTPSSTGTTAAIYNCNTSIALGQWNAQGTTLAATLTSNSNFRAQVLFGVKPRALDAAVREVYTLGKLPIPYTVPHFVKANIRNNGSDTLTSYPVILNITGANSFVDTAYVTILPGLASDVTFSGFSPTVNGNNLVTIRVPADSNNSNNVKTFNQIVSGNSYSYAEPTLPAAGGVGFNGGTGDFVAKFPYSGVTNAINQVGVNFSAGGVSLSIGIWRRDTITRLPSTLLWQSSTFTSVAGLNTIPVSPAAIINDTFFVGVIQSSTVNSSFAYQTENPIRGQTFYFRSPSGSGTWTDFAPNNSFRFMIEPRLQSANDVGFISVDYPCKVLPQNQSAIAPQGSITNYGTNSQSNVKVRCRIFNSTNVIVFNDSLNVPFITASQTIPLTFLNSFITITPGTYSIKIWSELTGDASLANDTTVLTFTINNIPIIGQENRLQFNGSNSYVEIKDKPTIKPTSNFTIETWVLNNNPLLNPGCIFSADSSNADTSITIETVAKKIRVTLKTSTGLYFLTSNDTVPTNNWAHVAVTYNGSELSIYINGDTSGSATVFGTVVYKPSSVYLGKRAGSNSVNSASALNGGLDEFRIWNNERTQTQIIQNMHNKIANFSSTNLMAYYRMNEGLNNNALTDASGNCNAADLVNMNSIATGVGQVWYAGSVLLDTIQATIFTVTGSSLMTSSTNKIAIKVNNPTGTGGFAVYNSVQPIIGAVPNSFINNSTSSWMVYKYGDLTFDSARLELIVPTGSIVATSSLSDLSLNARLSGFGNWSLTRAGADDYQRTTNDYRVKFLLLNTDTFNRQFIVSSNVNTLPVTFISFNAMKVNENVMLNWATAAEINNNLFEIERSFDGINFDKIGEVHAHQNSNTINKYQFLDKEILNLPILYYRLKQIDFDGSFSYSIIISLNNNLNDFSEKIVVSPNPFLNELNIKYNAVSSNIIETIIYDINGAILIKKTIPIEAGLNSINIEEVSNLPRGMYFLKINKNGVFNTFKLIK